MVFVGAEPRTDTSEHPVYGRPRIKDEIRDLVFSLHKEGLSERRIKRRLLVDGIKISIGSVHNIIHERVAQKMCSENHAGSSHERGCSNSQ